MILVRLDFLVHKVIVELKVNLVQKVNLVAQSLAHLVSTAIQVNLVFLELKVNVVYVVFLVYLAIHQLSVAYPVHKDVCTSLY